MILSSIARFISWGLFVFLISLGAADAQPKISYLLPDIGTPGMNTYVEIIGPAQSNGAFGRDQVWLNNSTDPVRVELTNKSDSSLVKLGPIVVSQNGRMISTQIFVNRDAATNNADWEQLTSQFRIPIRVFANGNYSNSDTFYIVKPWPAIALTSSATLGSGGVLGKRSRRGAMIVKNLDLRSGVYDITRDDCDLATPGNQGYLPCVIMSSGTVSIAKDATLSVSASGLDAGPGGGGGGAKFNDNWSGAVSGLPGAGFTGGQGTPYIAGGVGTGNSWPEGTRGDSSLNGVPGPRDVYGSDRFGGGTGEGGQGTGGGTGFCFGSSGEGNRTSNCSTTNVIGGYGGGSGASECFPVAYGGGGGGFGSAGGGPAGGGGNANGNSMLVPAAGGGGGAGGNPWAGLAGEGGGGGGYIAIHSYLGSSISTIKADGARAGDQTLQESGHFSGAGGGGAGGGIQATSKLALSLVSLSAVGGLGGNVTVESNSDGERQFGGAGGAGRIRLDGVNKMNTLITPNTTRFVGPTTDTSRYVDRTFVLSGSSDGSTTDIYIAGEHSGWQLLTSFQFPAGAWSKSIDLPGTDNFYYLVAAQRVANPSTVSFLAEPTVVLSQAAANLLVVGGACSYSVLMESQRIHHGSKGTTISYPLKIKISHPFNTDSVLHATSQISYALSFDSTLLDVVAVTPPYGFVVRSQQVSAGLLTVTLAKRDTSISALDSLGNVLFVVLDSSKRHSELMLAAMDLNSGSSSKSCCIYQAEGAAWVILIDPFKQSVSSTRPTRNLISSIFPNPSSGTFVIEFTRDRASELSYSIFDIRGARVGGGQNIQGRPGRNILHLATELPSGKYLLKLSSGAYSEDRPFEIVR